MNEPELVLPAEEYEKYIDSDGKERTRTTIRQIVLHTVGLDYGNKPKFVKKKGEKICVPYRNYFNTYVGEYPWPMLEEAGYAAHGRLHHSKDFGDTTNYYLTEKGLEWLSGQLGFKIVDDLR